MTENSRKFDISVGFVLLLAVLYLLDSGKLLFPALAAALLHEAGHIIAIKLCGGVVEGVRMRVFGARVIVSAYPILSYKSEIICAAAGPFAGLFAAYASSLTAGWLGLDGLYTFSGLNLVLSAVNLLPIYPLDGGRILYNLMLMLLDFELAHRVASVVSVVFCALMMLMCAVVIKYTGFRLTLVIFTAFILIKTGEISVS